ncbi:ABC transporter ATP-binding protein [Algoriphagus aestuariicola]|jgi:subfamily B ATP-binding cassette protein MsbA|uniref:ABC transporter ATP-binding protein n=1 Tax=Algoriphagus aestuariicola TaxID=1852016 RepID=A0ABS3BNJ6_9BACT|nr:ABC transporter ATP-binding protein [Algoriphagus aestuariicola]MBN7799905.1 ABC transporter ATP-binding protein [Algoriphagus aestuariicola]
MLLKNIVEKNFKYFSYFFSYLGYNIFLLIFLSVLVGVFDGFGLALFIPLFEVAVDPAKSSGSDTLGEFSFLIDFLTNAGIEISIGNILTFMTSLFVLKGFFKFMDSYFKVSLQISFVKRLRFQMLDGLSHVSYQHFVGLDAGRIQNTLSGEVYKVTGAFISYFNTLQHAVLLFVYTGLALISDWKFALLVSIGGFLSNLIFKILFRKTETASITISNKGHAFQSYLIQAVQHFKYLKATSYFAKYQRKLVNQIHEIESFQRKIGFYNSLLNGLREPMILVIVVFVIIIQINFLGGTLSSIMLSLMFFYRALNYVISIQSSWQMFISQFGGIVATSEMIKMFDSGKEENKTTNSMGDFGQIRLDQVGFRFKENGDVLKNITLEVNPKEAIAFVGPSGSGKTTLVNIIVGLLEPTQGNIRINGVERSALDLSVLRGKIGYITQEPVIFNDTVFNNVTFWAEKNPENLRKFNQAIELANLSEFVAKLDQRENTPLGDNGVRASGGQKQRISIARELFKEVEIIVFDEATSALDSDSENVIQENINSLQGKYTLLLIAHRLSTIKNADCIHLIKDGQISASGDFETLMSQNNYFNKMVKLQEF